MRDWSNIHVRLQMQLLNRTTDIKFLTHWLIPWLVLIHKSTEKKEEWNLFRKSNIQFKWNFICLRQKTNSHNSNRPCENVISTSVAKCHYQAVTLLNLNTASLSGSSSAEERIKVLIMFWASGIFMCIRTSTVIHCPLYVLSFYLGSLCESKAYDPSPLTAHGCAVRLGSEWCW